MKRTAKRTKSLTVTPIDEIRFRFVLSLEDIASSADGDEVIHSLEIEGTVSLPDLEILTIEPRAIYQPYAQCTASLEPVRQLVGTRIRKGFRMSVIEAMGRVRGCTHFMTLVQDLAAAHTLSVFLRMREKMGYVQGEPQSAEWMQLGLEVEPHLENACITLQAGGEVIEAAKRKAKAVQS